MGISEYQMTARTLLRGVSLRVTPVRAAILSHLLQFGRPVSHADLWRRKKIRAFNRVTVYRTLLTLQSRAVVHAVQGTDGLKTFFGTVVAMGVSFCMHMVHNPIIDVKGDRATGRWYYEAPTTDAATGNAQWMAGTYLEEYVREGGEWKFASMSTKWKYITPYDQGWAKDPGALLAMVPKD